MATWNKGDDTFSYKKLRECSNCEFIYFEEEAYNFCPHCGRQMNDLPPEVRKIREKHERGYKYRR